MQMPSDNEFYEKRRKDWETLTRLGYDHSNQADCWYPVGTDDYKAPRMTEGQARSLAHMIQRLEEE